MSKLSEKIAPGIGKSSIAEVGLMADFSGKKGFLKQDFLNELVETEVERIIEQMHQEREESYQKLLGLFRARLQEDPQIFEKIDAAEVLAVFEQMARLMLVFHPDRISADVTFDTSVILQAHYGAFRFYWETFLPSEGESLHSTLNVYSGEALTYTGGGKAGQVAAQFAQIIRPLFKKFVTLKIA